MTAIRFLPADPPVSISASQIAAAIRNSSCEAVWGRLKVLTGSSFTMLPLGSTVELTGNTLILGYTSAKGGERYLKMKVLGTGSGQFDLKVVSDSVRHGLSEARKLLGQYKLSAAQAPRVRHARPAANPARPYRLPQ